MSPGSDLAFCLKEQEARSDPLCFERGKAIDVANVPSVSDFVKNKEKTNLALHEKINQRATQKAFEEKIGFEHKTSISGKKANEIGLDYHVKEGNNPKDYENEWGKNDIVKNGVLPKNQPQGTITKVHDIKDEPSGNFLGSTEELKGLTRVELKDQLALPASNSAKYKTDYKGDKDRQVSIGKIGENAYGGKNGNKTQIKINQPKPETEEFYTKGTTENKE